MMAFLRAGIPLTIWKFKKIKIENNRPWWPSGLIRRSNSSRVAAEDPGSNPAWGMYGTVMDLLYMLFDCDMTLVEVP